MSNSEMHHRKGSDCKYCKARELRIRELEDLDSRWRPMDTAPKGDDAVTVEVLHEDGLPRFWDFRHSDPETQRCVAWRPAHPEWNEEGEG